MWASITITVSSNSKWAPCIRKEVSILFEQNLLDCKSPPLVVEQLVNDGNNNSEDIKADPGVGFFENFAFLNALFLTMENQGFTSSDLWDKNILIIHHGRSCCYWPETKIFSPTTELRDDQSGFKTYLEYIISLCSQLKKGCNSGGVWFAGTDSLIYGQLKNSNYDWESHQPDALCVTFNDRNFFKYCGYVEHDDDGVVTRIIGDRLSEDNVEASSLEVAGGIVYLKSAVVEKIVQLISKAPLDRTTYIGQDNGELPLKLSLYFDILGPFCAIERDYYLSGLYSLFPETEDATEKRYVRKLLWQHLNSYKLKVFSAIGLRHCFITDKVPLKQILACNSLAIPYGKNAKVLHSYVNKAPKEALKCANSVIEPGLKWSKDKEDDCLVVISSTIEGRKNLELAGAACLITTSLTTDMVSDCRLINNFCMIGISIRVNNELKKGRFVFSIVDIPSESNHSFATYFGMSWSKYLNLKGIQEEDIWSTGICKTLLTARLFPLAENITGWRNLLWLQSDTTDDTISPSRLESWRSSRRYSIDDFFQMCDPADSLQHLRATAGIAISKSIFNQPLSLTPFFRRACAEKWTETLLRVCDEKAATGNNNKDTSRALAAIADLLAYKANLPGVRGGPGCNKEWAVALHLFQHVSLEEGVIAMANTRSKWMDTPERLIRASRHYERAIQILISSTVNTVQKHMVKDAFLFHSSRPEIGTWIEAECPARIDLAGGWSDTPPVCWEIESGGAVVNLAILVNGKRPIGARGRRLDDLKLVLVSEGSNPVTISTLEDALNYNNPTAFGSLLKAVLVCAGVLQHNASLDLSQQLEKSLGSGLELHSWSLLPSGSGLGTSSILASALLAVVYTLMHGVCFNRLNLIHGVLRIESLLTTGGGWQDQVGGIMGGCNLGYSPCDSELRVQVNHLALSESIVDSINQRLILIHTGQVRLARNLLQSVIRNWYGYDESIVHQFNQLVDNARKCAVNIVSGNVEELGRNINVYWKQKKAIAPGCEPKMVSELMEKMSPLVYGQSLAGAGGGGFYYALLNETGTSCLLDDILATFINKEKMVVYSAAVDQSGISLFVNGKECHIP